MVTIANRHQRLPSFKHIRMSRSGINNTNFCFEKIRAIKRSLVPELQLLNFEQSNRESYIPEQ